MRAVPLIALCGLLLRAGEASSAPVTSLAFSPDGTVLAAASGRNMTLLSATTGKHLHSAPCDGERVLAVAFQPHGPLLAVGTGLPGEKGGVRLLDWRQKVWLGTWSTNSDVITSVAFSPDSKSLACSSADKSACVYRIENAGSKLTETFVLTGHSAAVQAIAFSPDGRTLLTASVDRSLKVWSAADGKLLRTFGQHTDAVQALAFRPVTSELPDAPPYCATGGDDRVVRVWQPTIGRMVRIVRHHDGPVLALAFTPDGRSLLSAGKEGIIRRLDADSDDVLGEWRASDDWIYSIAIAPDGRTLVTGDWAGRIQRWSVGDKELTALRDEE